MNASKPGRSLLRVLGAICLALLLAATGMSRSSYVSGGRHCLSPHARVLHPLDIDALNRVFLRGRSDDALHLYLCGSTTNHGLTNILASRLAQRGSGIVPELKRALKHDGTDFETIAILEAIEEIHRQTTYNVGRDSELIALMRTASTRISDVEYYGTGADIIRRLGIPDHRNP